MVYRCPACRTRRTVYALYLAHLRDSGHVVCRCGGYHYDHRPGSLCCTHNPMSDYYAASRAGVEGDDLKRIRDRCIRAMVVKNLKPGDDDCPF